MTDLNSLIASGSGLTLVEANGISDNGFVTGYAYNNVLGGYDVFLLIPNAVSEPSSLIMLSVGGLMALGFHARPRWPTVDRGPSRQ